MADHFVYVLRCADDTYYTGYTSSLTDRIAEHAAGDGSKYTRGRTPVRPVHAERFSSKSAAMQREHAIKSLRREQKERLIAGERPAVGERVSTAALPTPE